MKMKRLFGMALSVVLTGVICAVPIYAEPEIEQTEYAEGTVSGQDILSDEIEDTDSFGMEFSDNEWLGEDDSLQYESEENGYLIEESAYSGSDALNFAKNNMSGHSWDCAQFVKHCLVAGGFNEASSIGGGCGNLYRGLKQHFSVKQMKIVKSGSYAKIKNDGSLVAGDVIIWYCPTCGKGGVPLYKHAELVSSTDSGGYVCSYAYNNKRYGTTSYYDYYDGANHAIMAYGIHINTSDSSSQPTTPVIEYPDPYVGSINVEYQANGAPIFSAYVGVGSGTSQAILTMSSKSGERVTNTLSIAPEGKVSGLLPISSFSNYFGDVFTVQISVTDSRGKTASNATVLDHSHEVILSQKEVSLNVGEQCKLSGTVKSTATIEETKWTGGYGDALDEKGNHIKGVDITEDGLVTAKLPGTYYVDFWVTCKKGNVSSMESTPVKVEIELETPQIKDVRYDEDGCVVLDIVPVRGADGYKVVHCWGENRVQSTDKGESIIENLSTLDVPIIRFEDNNYYRIYAYKNVAGQEYVSNQSNEASIEIGDIPRLRNLQADIYKGRTEVTWDKNRWADQYVVSSVPTKLNKNRYNLFYEFFYTPTRVSETSFVSNNECVDYACAVIPWRNTWSSKKVNTQGVDIYYDVDGETTWFWPGQMHDIHVCFGDYVEEIVPIYFVYDGNVVIKNYKKGSAIKEYIPNDLDEGKYFGGWHKEEPDAVWFYGGDDYNEFGEWIADQPLVFTGIIMNHPPKKSGGEKNTDNKNNENRATDKQSKSSSRDERKATETKTSSKYTVDDFVSRMYTVALGRNAEEAGLNDWSGQLINGQSDGATLARGFICSGEFKNKGLSNEDYVDTLYRTFFNREADAGGRANWLGELTNGASREKVLAGFVNSAEFGNLCDEYDIARGTMEEDGSNIYNAGVRDFVLRNYEKALGRPGETAGVEDWSHKINKGEMSALDVAQSFFHSQEFMNKNTSNDEYVEILYRTFLGREYDDAGKADWVGQLNAGKSRDDVMKGFAYSQEFKNIMAQYGL